MTDPTFDVIFDDLVDADEELRSFLEALESVLPEGAFLLETEDGVAITGTREIIVPAPVQAELKSKLLKEESASCKSETGEVFCGVTVPKFQAVVMGQFCAGVDLSAMPGGKNLLMNSIRLAIYEQEHTELVADKEQAVRQINILKQQHGKLIEDNYRQYRLNQEREKEYARKLESEIAQQTAELREANARLEEISRLKSDFLANMSHELRTPMNAIIGFTELLAETELDDEQEDYTNTIAQSASSLLGLINDILDLAKIESGKLELEERPYDLADTVENVEAMFRLPAQAKNVEIKCEIDDKVPAWIMGDSIRLRQILVNLVGNAMKFTESGSITIRVSFQGDSGTQKVCRFCVQDTGIGIPAERVEAIFDKFTQADGSTTRKYGGSGLGLAICRQLVALMGGTISVESEEGKGSSFIFTLPLEVARQEVAKTPEKQKAVLHAKKSGRILLVEDNPVNQRLAKILISRQGYDVDVANDGLEALEHIKSESYDLVFMDVQMPNMDGLTATSEIRKLETDEAASTSYKSFAGREEPLLIVGLTAHARKEDEQACYDAGMNAFLTKPIIKDKLTGLLAEMMPGEDETAS